MLKDLLNSALLAADEAGNYIMEVYQKADFSVRSKSDSSPVTSADEGSNEIILKHLKILFPEFGFLSEESADDFTRLQKEYVFIIDPLDGTKEFIKRNGDFSICIALVRQGRPVFGLVHDPVRRISYYASAGEGAFRLQNGRTERIRVNEKTSELTLLRSRSRVSEKLSRVFERDEITIIRKMGSALKGCAIAAGEAEMYYSLGYTMEWDTCAIDLIVHEAGGVFEDLNGELMRYNRRDPLNKNGFYVLNRRQNLFL